MLKPRAIIEACIENWIKFVVKGNTSPKRRKTKTVPFDATSYKCGRSAAATRRGGGNVLTLRLDGTLERRRRRRSSRACFYLTTRPFAVSILKRRLLLPTDLITVRDFLRFYCTTSQLSPMPGLAADVRGGHPSAKQDAWQRIRA